MLEKLVYHCLSVLYLNVHVCWQLWQASPVELEGDFCLIEKQWSVSYHGQHSVKAVVGGNLKQESEWTEVRKILYTDLRQLQDQIYY